MNYGKGIIVFLSFLFIILNSCAQVDTAPASRTAIPVDRDSIITIPVDGDSVQYRKTVFKELMDEHPELVALADTTKSVTDPDILYYNNHKDFASEAGQDEYCVLYAYFLGKRNGSKYAEQRKKLIGIYNNLNHIFSHLEHGGSYFRHQSWRILAYAEYAVAQYKWQADNSVNYNVAKQKTLYIQSLRQLIDDNIRVDGNYIDPHFLKDKMEFRQEVNKFVDELDKEITTHFYLRYAQQFHYDYYGKW